MSQHKRQSSRVVPAIPRQLTRPRQARKPSVSGTEIPIHAKAPQTKDSEYTAVPKETADRSKANQPIVEDAKEISTLAPEVEQGFAIGAATPGSRLNVAPPAIASPEGLPCEDPVATVKETKISETPVREDKEKIVSVPRSKENTRSSLSRISISGAKTGLPPPFYPAGSSEKSSSRMPQQQRPLLPNAMYHSSHPSTEAIVFGGPADSSNTSPAPPGSAGSSTFPSSAGPIYMGGGPPVPYSSYGHADHYSSAYASPYPQSYDPRFNSFGLSQPFPPPMRPLQQTGSLDQRLPTFANGSLETTEPKPQASVAGIDQRNDGYSAANYAYRSAASLQSGPGALDQSNHGQQRSANGVHNHVHSGSTSAQTPALLQQSRFDPDEYNMRAISDHLRSHFGSSEFADYVMTIANDDSIARTVSCHSLMLARSPKFRELLNTAVQDEKASKTLRITKEYYFRKPDAFVDAVHYLYGGRLIEEDRFLHNSFIVTQQCSDARSASEMSSDFMAYALSYAASGCTMEIPELAFRGISIATRLLRWDTVELALSFALQGGLNASWRDDLLHGNRGGSTASDDSSIMAETGTGPTYDPHSTALLYHIISFLCFNFPPEFTLDVSAPQLVDAPRLPELSTRASRSSASHPGLKGIRFGEAPTGDPTGPSMALTILSSIMFSLPFPVLKSFLESGLLGETIGWPAVFKHMQNIVTEREKRRLSAVKDHSAHLSDIPEYTTCTANLFWQEIAEPLPQQRPGFRLVRYRKGIDTPPSTASTGSKT